MSTEKHYQLAYKYAPVFAQKVKNEWTVADQIAPIDFAGSISDVTKNPDALYKIDKDSKISTKIYYSVCETATHYFLLYGVYHILDWWKRYKPKDLYNYIRDRLDEHIHDMEGALLVVTKKPKALIDGMVTISHRNFYLYTEPKIPSSDGKSRNASRQNLRIAKFNETVDGNIWLDKTSKRVKLYIQAQGHGIRGDHKGWGGGDEIWYYSPEEVTATSSPTDPKAEKIQPMKYELEDIFAENGLWDHRFNDKVFRQNKEGKWGFVVQEENKLLGGAANPPWSWNDHNDSSPIGEIATDPARFIIRYAQGWGPVSMQYIFNPYQEIGVSSSDEKVIA